MSALDEIALHLDSLGLGKAGRTLFVNVEPADVERGILLRQFGGRRNPDYHGKGPRHLKFQGVFRSNTYADTLRLAEQVSTALTLRQRQLGGTWFYGIDPLEEPIPFGREASGTYTFVVNFAADWREMEEL